MSQRARVPTFGELLQFVRETTPDDEALQQLGVALEVQLRLNALSERVVGQFVDRARRIGHSWAEIGEILGVTRQAAHHRYQSWDQLQRLSEEAEACVSLAADEAQGLRHNYLGTEHILLGILRLPSSIGGKGLKKMGVRLAEVRKKVEETIGVGGRPLALPPISYSPNAQKLLELAGEDAIDSGYSLINSGHLVVAMSHLDSCVAQDILRQSKVDLEAAKAAIRPYMPEQMQEGEGHMEIDPGLNLENYLTKVAVLPRLTESELKKALNLARRGDKEAGKSVIKALLSDVANIALRVRPHWMEPLAAVREANLLLLELVLDSRVKDLSAALPGQIEERLESLEPAN